MEPRRRFRFLKAISEGSFGKVYLAEMVTGDNFSTVVAIKLLHGKWLGHEEIVMRSRDEARLLGLLLCRSISLECLLCGLERLLLPFTNNISSLL